MHHYETCSHHMMNLPIELSCHRGLGYDDVPRLAYHLDDETIDELVYQALVEFGGNAADERDAEDGNIIYVD